jgi:pyruvate,water dikinase
MGSDVVGFDQIDRGQVALVGGKAANLGELSRIDGVRVPPGFCVTTEVFRRTIADAPPLAERLDRLSALDPDDRGAVGTLSAEIRTMVEAIAMPDGVADAIADAVARLDAAGAYAVRSSATSEDLPTASFAGQLDTYIDVVGVGPILDDVRRCWASLFTERAVSYRARNGIDHRTALMGVVVQRMVAARASGVLFTAHPVTGNRTVTSVEACVGLGDALVSGRVNADVFEVRDGEIVDRSRGDEPVALSDVEVVDLARLGRRIETHFGSPQDIEWCLDADGFQIVQSRPITTLFPIPATDDGDRHVYLSVGHQQMMTDPIAPLGLSFFQLIAKPKMHEAGGRLFVEVTPALASPASRAGLLDLIGRSDPLTRDALDSVLERGFIQPVPDDAPVPAAASGAAPGAPSPTTPIETDRAVVVELMEANRASISELQRDIADKTGTALVDFIHDDIAELKRILFDPRSHQVFMSAMEATWWLNDHLQEWLGERNVADTLTKSVPDNVTSDMGLALLDVADVIRPHPEVVALLEGVEGDDFLDALAGVAGGREAREAIVDFLDRYGMRCTGEIDITRPRWSERPSTLVPVILGNVRNFDPGAGERRFELGRQEAWAKEQEVIERVRALPEGHRRADEVKAMIDRVRTFIGYREYPKFGMINRYFVYKQALLGEARRLVQAGVLRHEDDIFFLSFDELRDVVGSDRPHDGLVEQLVDERKEALRWYAALTPPRVLTSEGEALDGAYRRDDLPDGALPGLAVSAGVVEGRARVLHDMSEADLDPGDILVTPYTDPSWSPLFVAIGGLVTEVGGLMTHGAVIAREYGLPAVVAVDHATRLIRDGQRIRVHGTEGYVEVLADDDETR